jgi:2-C-methyl-D-erythritol 4-phosphate cytidylyltransferase
MLTAIIVAAGSSQRLGFDKLMAPIAGKPTILHTVDAFERTRSVYEIVVVTRADRVAEFKLALSSLKKVRAIIPGGEHRHNSVHAGLRALDAGTTYVSVHDGARPLITSFQIDQVFEQAKAHGAAALAEPVGDTLKRAGDDLIVRESIDRHQVYAMQTPQIFERRLLEKAYDAVSANSGLVTDEVSAVELLGHKIVLVPNPDANFKITYNRDLKLAEAVLLQRQNSA